MTAIYYAPLTDGRYAEVITYYWLTVFFLLALTAYGLFRGFRLLPARIQKGLVIAGGGAVLWDCCWFSPQCYDWFFFILTPACWG